MDVNTAQFLFYTIAPLAAGAYALVVARRNRRLRERVKDNHEALSRWAEENGWRAHEGIDLHYADVADRITGLTGQPGDWAAGETYYNNNDVFMPSRKWEYGTILSRDNRVGELVVLGCFYEGESNHFLFASLPTDGVFEPYTADCFKGERLNIRGTVPGFEENTVSTCLKGLERPARLRLLNGQIFLFAPGWLTGESVADMAERLTRVNELLPQRPDLGPMR